jgi:hypothetical protein
MVDIDCDCTDEGPCENHCEVLAQREGASTRTADELLTVFIEDAVGIDPTVLSPYGRDVLDRANAALEAERSPHSGVAWLPMDDEGALADELASVAGQVESVLDARVYWADGFSIVRLTDDCPLLAD